MRRGLAEVVAVVQPANMLNQKSRCRGGPVGGILSLSIVLTLLGASGAVHAQPSVGQIVVVTEPTDGVMVFVDGAEVGTSPAIVTNLWPGSHVVVARTESGGRVQQVVEVRAGESTSARLVVPAAAPPVSPPPVVAPPQVPVPPPPQQQAPRVEASRAEQAAATAESRDPVEVAYPSVAPPPPGGWSGGPRGAPNAAFILGIVLVSVAGTTAIVGLALDDVFANGDVENYPLLIGEIGLIPVVPLLILGIALPWHPGKAEEAGQRFGGLYPTLALGTRGVGLGIGGAL